MNWDAIGAVGEIVGALAVIISLIYLAVQVKHMREASTQESRQMRNTSAREIFLSVSASQDLSNAWIKVEKGLPGPSFMLEPAAKLAEQTGTSVEEANQVLCNALALYLHYRAMYYSTSNEAEKISLRANTQYFFRSSVARFLVESFPVGDEPFVKEMVDAEAPPNKSVESDT